jgi:hypothetical protein
MGTTKPDQSIWILSGRLLALGSGRPGVLPGPSFKFNGFKIAKRFVPLNFRTPNRVVSSGVNAGKTAPWLIVEECESVPVENTELLLHVKRQK